MREEAVQQTGGAAPNAEPLWFAFQNERLLVAEKDPARVPRTSSLEKLGLETAFESLVGQLNGSPCWAAEVPDGAEAPAGTEFVDLRAIFASVDEGLFAVAGKAKQVVGWRVTHRFCGRCGGRPGPVEGEMALECPQCGMMHYPRLSPAVIVRVTRGDRVLLARSPGFPKGMRSVLAGFIEPGESIEDTVHREIREEVGLEVGNLRYFGSQPWPFPNSLMIGMTADHAGGEVKPEPGEIEDAGWYRADELPLLPPPVSIARRMIDAFATDSQS